MMRTRLTLLTILVGAVAMQGCAAEPGDEEEGEIVEETTADEQALTVNGCKLDATAVRGFAYGWVQGRGTISCSSTRSVTLGVCLDRRQYDGSWKAHSCTGTSTYSVGTSIRSVYTSRVSFHGTYRVRLRADGYGTAYSASSYYVR
jgi:hypothetical protein